MSALRLLAAAGHGAITGAALALLIGFAVLLALGGRALVVVSGSMEPALRVGDAAIVLPLAPPDARVGDVVTFAAPETGRITTHRLRSVRRRSGGRYAFVTKGDAANGVERWTLPAEGSLGRAVVRVPYAGHAFARVRSPLGWALLVAVPLVALGGRELRRIWRPAAGGADATRAA